MIAYVGSRTTKERNARGRGLCAFQIDPDGNWHEIQCIKAEENPSYQCIDKAGKFLYSVHGDLTNVSSYRILSDGTLELLNVIDIGFQNPVFITLDKDERFLLIASLQGGCVCTVERLADGSLGGIKNTFFFEGKKEGLVSTVHQCIWDRTGNFLICCAQGRVNGYGQMRIFRYDHENGSLTQTDRFMARTWDEPRHAVISEDNKRLYMCEEKGNKVLFFEFDETNGKIRGRQELTTLPETFLDYSDASGVVIDPSGKYVIVSNRYSDLMTTFRIDPETGFLRDPQFTSSGGKTPRFFCFGLDGLCYIANEDSDNITVFSLDTSSGRLIDTGRSIHAESPVCIIFH